MPVEDRSVEIEAERRANDRRQRDVPVLVDRREGQRRAARLMPTPHVAGCAIVVDTWPLMRAGIRQLLTDADMHVAADDISVEVAVGALDDPLDLAVLGVTDEPLAEGVQRIRRLDGTNGASAPRILVLLERIEADLLRRLLALGVDGVIQRTVGLEELGRVCARVLAGERVLSGGVLSVLASSGLEVVAAPVAETSSGEASLTRKELEVLGHLASHRSNTEIAGRMHVSAATVKTHLSHLYAKLGVPGRREAVVAAVERGLLS